MYTQENGMFWTLIIVTCLVILIGMLCAISTNVEENKTNTKPSSIDDETARNRVKDWCGVYCAQSDNWHTSDTDVFMNFARNHKDFVSWRFFKVDGKRYAVKINKPTLRREVDAVVFKIANGTLDNFVPYSDFDSYTYDYFETDAWSPKTYLADHVYWAGLYEYTNGTFRGGWGTYKQWRYDWTPAVIKNGFATIERYDSVLNKKYVNKYYLPKMYADIYNLELGRTIIEL